MKKSIILALVVFMVVTIALIFWHNFTYSLNSTLVSISEVFDQIHIIRLPIVGGISIGIIAGLWRYEHLNVQH